MAASMEALRFAALALQDTMRQENQDERGEEDEDEKEEEHK